MNGILVLKPIRMTLDTLLTTIVDGSSFANLRAHHTTRPPTRETPTHESNACDRQQKGHRHAMNPQSLRSTQK